MSERDFEQQVEAAAVEIEKWSKTQRDVIKPLIVGAREYLIEQKKKRKIKESQ